MDLHELIESNDYSFKKLRQGTRSNIVWFRHKQTKELVEVSINSKQCQYLYDRYIGEVDWK